LGEFGDTPIDGLL